MAADIVPGYDFGVTEVPTYDKMLIAAAGLQVSNITLDDLPSSIVSLLTGTTSGDSGASLPDEGWMWHTPSGDTFVETRWYLDDLPDAGSGVTEERIAVPLFKNDGGWITARYRDNAAGDELGAPITTNVRYSNDDRYLTQKKSLPNFETDGGLIYGVALDTGVSGSRGLTVGRGPCAIRDLGVASENDGTERRFYHNTVLAWDFDTWQQSTGTQGSDRFIGWYMGRSRYRGSTGFAAMAGCWLNSHMTFGAK